MERILLNQANFHEALAKAKEVLANGGVVLLPTETVYGLVGKFEDEEPTNKIYQLKMREKSKLLAAFVNDYNKLKPYGLIDSELIKSLANDYCPGKITIIAKRSENRTIGFRIPEHEFVLALLNELDFPIASTSANVSGEPNILSVDEALSTLQGDIELIIDGGIISKDALASTVVDATDSTKARVLRQGELIINPKYL